jgi:hypothetical protein
MPSVTFTFGNKTKTFDISGPNAARLVAWATAAYPTIPNPQAGEEGQPTTLPNPEPVLSAIDGLWAGIRANILAHEREVARKAVAEPGDLT